MDAIVTNVREALQAELLPLVQDHLANRAVLRSRRISRPQNLAAEVLPAQCVRRPIHDEIVKLGLRQRELLPHGHVEAIDDEERLSHCARTVETLAGCLEPY